MNPSVASLHFRLNIFLSAFSSSVLPPSLHACVFNTAANKKRDTKGFYEDGKQLIVIKKERIDALLSVRR